MSGIHTVPIFECLEFKSSLYCLFLQYSHEGRPVPFDTAMARWHALHNTYEERYVPRFKNLAYVAIGLCLPIYAHYKYTQAALVSDFTPLNNPCSIPPPPSPTQ